MHEPSLLYYPLKLIDILVAIFSNLGVAPCLPSSESVHLVLGFPNHSGCVLIAAVLVRRSPYVTYSSGTSNFEWWLRYNGLIL